MSQLGLIIKTEYLTDIKAKSFWIGTFVMPLLMIAFGGFVGYLAATSDSDTTSKMANPAAPDPSEMSGIEVFAMLSGILLALFLMIYGAQIFNKVKQEKTNRIMEVLATCVEGRTMMLAKVISVGLLGLTQLVLWGIIIAIVAVACVFIFNIDLSLNELNDPRIYLGIVWTLLFFIGGYIFYGSLYAACGAMTDKDNENQAYMTAITFLLLGAFYVSEFAVNHSSSAIVIFCSIFPFTSCTIGAVNAVSGHSPIWMTLISVVSLYVFAWLAVNLAGKLYTSSLLLKGKKLTPKDILLFMKSK